MNWYPHWWTPTLVLSCFLNLAGINIANSLVAYNLNSMNLGTVDLLLFLLFSLTWKKRDAEKPWGGVKGSIFYKKLYTSWNQQRNHHLLYNNMYFIYRSLTLSLCVCYLCYLYWNYWSVIPLFPTFYIVDKTGSVWKRMKQKVLLS